jgi:hypothetical protein
LKACLLVFPFWPNTLKTTSLVDDWDTDADRANDSKKTSSRLWVECAMVGHLALLLQLKFRTLNGSAGISGTKRCLPNLVQQRHRSHSHAQVTPTLWGCKSTVSPMLAMFSNAQVHARLPRE